MNPDAEAPPPTLAQGLLTALVILLAGVVVGWVLAAGFQDPPDPNVRYEVPEGCVVDDSDPADVWIRCDFDDGTA